MKPGIVPKSKFTDLQLLGHVKGLAWLSLAQLKTLDDSMTSLNVKHKGIIFEERGVVRLDTHILLTGTAELSHVNNGSRPLVVAILSAGVIFRMALIAPVIDHDLLCTPVNDWRVSQLSTHSFLPIRN